jgi:hypothetical protein
MGLQIAERTVIMFASVRMKVERQPHYCQEKERNQKINRSCQDLPKNLHYTNLTPKSLATNGVKHVIPGKIYSIFLCRFFRIAMGWETVSNDIKYESHLAHTCPEGLRLTNAIVLH